MLHSKIAAGTADVKRRQTLSSFLSVKL